MAVPKHLCRFRLNPTFSPITCARNEGSKYPRRWNSSTATPSIKPDLQIAGRSATSKPKSPLSRLSTVTLVRSLLLGSFFTFRPIYRLGITCLSWIANSKSPVLNPDKNVFLRALIRPIIYDHFCGGVNATEVGKTVADIKRMGYTGVILCYGKEILLNPSAPKVSAASTQQDAGAPMDELINIWRDGNLETLAMVGADDYIGIKYTGAGPSITKALGEGRSPPQQFVDAMDSICKQAAAQGSLVWIDAEQQVLQATIDTWTIDLMRRYNRNGQALVSNTVQAYLKSSRDTIAEQLRLAQDEGWTLGIKLVRGAYIESEIRDRIHDTKPETDASYNGIVKDILTKSFPGFEKSNFPTVDLFIAGHNTESIRRASGLIRDIVASGEKCGSVKFGQLYGMADDTSCELLQLKDEAEECGGLSEKDAAIKRGAAPRPYKCLVWGSVQECMQFLIRRAVENRGAVERTKSGAGEMRAELRRRLLPF